MNLKTNPELLPLIEWWEKDGKQTVIYLAVAAVAVCGWYGYKGHQAAVRTAASEALVSATTTEELEEVVSKYGSKKAGGALKLRLAKSYFDAARYDEALNMYAALAGKAPEGFAGVPEVGKAQCLEAMGKFDEAKAAFETFAAENPEHFLTLTAQLGAARCICQAGDKKAAQQKLADLKAALKDDDGLAKARVEATEDLVKRYVKPAVVAAAPAPAEPAAK